MKQIILASASPRRRELLSQAGIPFVVKPSQAEEKITVKEPGQAVEELSLLKCRDIYAQTTGDVAVIGADTVVAAEGRILGKPADKEEAVSMLTMLQGKQHEVYTGVTVMVREEGKENIRTFHEKTEVYFYPMTEEEIRGYVENLWIRQVLTESRGNPQSLSGKSGGIIIRLWGCLWQDSIRNAEKWDWK